jgi:hypothetical protein
VKRPDDLLCQEDYDSSTCIRCDVKATPSGCGLNMETCETHYGKAVAQFTVQMLLASIRTPPREI